MRIAHVMATLLTLGFITAPLQSVATQSSQPDAATMHISASPALYYCPEEQGYQLLPRSSYTICFDSQNNIPVWTAYTPQKLAPKNPLDSSNFRPLTGHVIPETYNHSGAFDQGHLVPAKDMSFSVWAFYDSYLMENAAPQDQYLNRTTWRKIENYVRKQAGKNLIKSVVTGTIPSSKKITPTLAGTPQITIPRCFYKILYYAEMQELFIAPNYSLKMDDITQTRGRDIGNKLLEALRIKNMKVLDSVCPPSIDAKLAMPSQ
ncbi:MAG: DNA/RNA non-specific endonuclease [Desulfovibrionales bacterium]|nr:DNA/RNA non-specific endonuclease [Desulfovibrionales bacterium]